MGGKHRKKSQELDCGQCQSRLQEYLDGTLEKTVSMGLFLHLRDCDGCQQEHDRLEGLFKLLSEMPSLEVPVDFDEKILSSVNYEAYREMAAIRRDRVAVIFEEESLPVFIRSGVTRWAGIGVAAVALGVNLAGGPGFLQGVVVAGLLPELIVRLQGVGRRAVLATRRSES